MAIFSFKKPFLSLLLLGTLNLASGTTTSCTEEPVPCTEDPESKFVFTLNYKRGEIQGVTSRRCTWLSREVNKDIRAQLCQNGVGYSDLKSAAEMCPVTCGSCKLTLSSLDPLSFNPVGAPICFSIDSANPVDASTFYSDLKLIVNGAESTDFTYIIGQSSFCSTNLVTVGGLLDIHLEGTKVLTGETFVYKSSATCGENTATISVYDEDGNPYTETVKVTAISGDNSDVTSIKYTTIDGTVDGTVTFENIPDRTILYQAVDEDDGRFGVTAGYAGAELSITLEGFSEPSDIDNNDFAQGLEGWEVPSDPIHVNIVEHVEDVGGTTTRRHLSKKASDADVKKRMELANENRKSTRSNTRGGGKSRPHKSAVTLFTQKMDGGREVQVNDDLATNNDVELDTAGIRNAAESLTRTFKTNPGTKGVNVYYRFVTTEVPGGYYGSQFNDWYKVSIRSSNLGTVVIDQSNMNNIPLADFDAAGSTPWRDLGIVELDEVYGDTIEVAIEVGNLVDCIFDSSVIIDLVETF